MGGQERVRHPGVTVPEKRIQYVIMAGFTTSTTPNPPSTCVITLCPLTKLRKLFVLSLLRFSWTTGLFLDTHPPSLFGVVGVCVPHLSVRCWGLCMRSRVVGMVGARCAPLVPTLPWSSHTRCLLSQGIPEGAGLLLNLSSGYGRFDSSIPHPADFPVLSGACLSPLSTAEQV